MKLRELSKDEFATYALTHEQNTFHQTLAWGELKATNGWRNYYVGLIDDNDKIIGASLLLSKKLVLNINLFYAPRGFLIDYKDVVVLKTFTKLVKEFARKKKAIFIKIDPYVMYKEHDINGELVENGADNSEVVDNLIKLGYKHKGFTVYQGTLQPRWMFVLDVENKTEDELLKEMYHPTTRHVITNT
jgi:peptidoglycan pentaglycine glycine transferase (the second and third glycine)